MLFQNTGCNAYEGMSPQQVADLARSYKHQSDCLNACFRQLACLMKEAAFESTEVYADGVRKHFDDFVKELDKSESERDLQKSLDGGKETMIAFINQEKEYYQEKGGEFRNLIDLLRSKFTTVMGESRMYNVGVYERTVRTGRMTDGD